MSEKAKVRVIVCGPRDWDDEHAIWYALGELDLDRPHVTVIQGDAPGVDRLAAKVARLSEMPCETYPANWRLYGKAAGPRRNALMLSMGKPDRVVAFRRGETWTKGTLDMVTKAHEAGVPITVVMTLPEGNVCFRDFDPKCTKEREEKERVDA